jgi:hypothetical protein
MKWCSSWQSDESSRHSCMRYESRDKDPRRPRLAGFQVETRSLAGRPLPKTGGYSQSEPHPRTRPTCPPRHGCVEDTAECALPGEPY